MYEHSALGYMSGLALCLTKVRSSQARCPATALILNCVRTVKVITIPSQVSDNVSTFASKFLRGKWMRERELCCVQCRGPSRKEPSVIRCPISFLTKSICTLILLFLNFKS